VAGTRLSPSHPPAARPSPPIAAPPFFLPALHTAAHCTRATNMSAAVSPSDAVDGPSPAARRKSGRVSRKPEKFAPTASPTNSTKRKRAGSDDSGLDADDASTSSEGDSSEGEPDEEELRERRRKRKSNGPAKRPAPKKPKTNGKNVSLAMRPAGGAPKAKRPRKVLVRKSMLPEQETEGLYGRSRGCSMGAS
jgi:cohesin complex subunit SA-1/2